MPPDFCIMQPKLRCHIRTRVTWEESSFVASNVINVSFKCKRIWRCLDFQIRKRRWESQKTRKRYWQTCKVSHSKGKKKKKSVEWLNNGMKMLNSTVVIHVKALLPKYEEMRQKMKAWEKCRARKINPKGQTFIDLEF